MESMKNDLGGELRAARQQRGWSLRAVATAAGISPSLLSQVENGKTHPSVSTLYALVTHLGVSIDDLLGNVPTGSTGAAEDVAPSTRSSTSAIQRREDNPIIEMENGVQWERLAVGPTNQVDPLVTTYQPGGSSSTEGKLMRHSGIEYGYLLEGTLTLKLDFETHILRAGDSLCFDSSRPHLYINEGDTEAKGLWFVVGRRDFTQHAQAVVTSRDDRPMNSAVDVLEAMDRFSEGSSATSER